MKQAVLFILFLCCTLTASALDKRQTKINTIKKSKEYLYSDITMSTPEAATSQAFEQLQREILSWATARADKKPGSLVSPKQINQKIDTMMVRRAEMYRVFAYVKKVKLIPLFSDWNLVLTDELDGDDAPDIESEVKDTIANAEIRSLLRNSFLGKKGGVIEQIKKAKNFFELKQIMEPLKEKGDITDYGKYVTAVKPEDCYLVVYDSAGNIKAILDKGDKTRQNFKTGKEDNIKNYRGCGAIWFTIKE